MKKYVPLLVVAMTIVSTTAFAARGAAYTPVSGNGLTPILLYQAYANPNASLGADPWQNGYAPAGPDAITAVPGVLAFDTNPTWVNFVPAARVPIDYWIKNVVLTKVVPVIGQCRDSFPTFKINQQGSANIRGWWPLLYETPGTTWTLNIGYGTYINYDDDGPGPNAPGPGHVVTWTWKVDATLDSMLAVIDLFHELPYAAMSNGHRCEVPLIYNELVYANLKSLLNQAKAESDPAVASQILLDFDTAVFDACATGCPADWGPNPGAQKDSVSNTWITLGYGIVSSDENPVCCKLVADLEYVAKANNIFMPSK